MTAPLALTLTSPDETAVLATRIKDRLSPGDILLLNGVIGSGKTHFARSLIQAAMTDPEDVPSPTFTLVQQYDTELGEIWHADLYRLTAAEEVDELGLTEAFDTAICLIEWPDRLGSARPLSALTLDFRTAPDQGEDTRVVTVTWTDPKWTEKLETIA